MNKSKPITDVWRENCRKSFLAIGIELNIVPDELCLAWAEQVNKGLDFASAAYSVAEAVTDYVKSKEKGTNI